ncbi:MAG TPA: 2,6-beta-D-fructofuranosidase [Kiritimatiellia bacterium]|nr:2,6-beta-D-fructofuranosidase [Kiritimatiellia bacterium]HQQ90732.1 2,6-beta-D-fructofuranosidase [Kiritimatiellia bacterium]
MRQKSPRSKSAVPELRAGFCAASALLACALCAAPRPDIVLADFEGADYGAWWAEGSAFGKAPARGTLPGQMPVSGFDGKGLANSFNGGDGATGLLTSPPFVIERRHFSFLIGGGGWPRKTCINLIVDGETVRTATGPNLKPGGSEALEPAGWDVTDLAGRTARIQIVDLATGGWGHINIDQIVACDAPPPPRIQVTREVTADKRWMLLPVKNGAKTCKMEVRSGAEVLRFFDIELAEGEPDWWAPFDAGAWQGRRLTLWANKLPAASKGLENVRFADEAFPKAGLYGEALRPRIHFSPARGWNNDPNGLVFYNGEYHLFFQHNPYGVNWGNMHWGHAVSKDLVHWTEVGEALYPDELGPMYSGSAVVDHANTSGFGKDGKAPLVLIYTAAGNPASQCIAHSLDGRTFTKYAGNPVVKNITGGNRDPKVFWHAPTRRWVMALYVGYTGKRHTIELLASSNLREWTRLSTVGGDTGGGHYLYECPDLFELAVAGSPDRQWVLFGADAQYAVGAFDGTVFKPAAERLRGHWGSIYYAAQTFDNAPGGRRILIPWLRAPSPGMSFNQCMGLPQELGLAHTSAGVRLTRRPVAEVAALRERTAAFGPFEAATGKAQPLTELQAELLELHIACSLSPDADVTFDVRGIPLRYHAARQELTLGTHKTAWPVEGGNLALILFVDRTCIELFSQDGLLYAPVAAIPDPKLKTVTWTVGAGQVKALRGSAHALRSIWP